MRGAARRRRPGRAGRAGCGRCPTLAATADELRGRLDAMLAGLADRRAEALPPAITLAAEVVRFLRAEPLLPPTLTPQPWPPDELRDRYRDFDRALGRTLRAAVRR